MPWRNLVLGGYNAEQRFEEVFEDERILTRDEVTRGEDGVYRVTP
jgi:hypothetical protein